jgi:WD40 repeat protein
LNSNLDGTEIMIGLYQENQKIQFLHYIIEESRFNKVFEKKTLIWTKKLVFALSLDWTLYAEPEKGNILIWDIVTNIIVFSIIDCDIKLNSLVFTSDNQFLMASGTTPSICVWNIKQGELVYQNKEVPSFSHLSISDDDCTIAGNDKKIF